MGINDRDTADIIDRLGQVLVLAEDDRHVVLVVKGKADDVERDADIDALLHPDPHPLGTAFRANDGRAAVRDGPRERDDTAVVHTAQLRGPERPPVGIVPLGGHSRRYHQHDALGMGRPWCPDYTSSGGANPTGYLGGGSAGVMS